MNPYSIYRFTDGLGQIDYAKNPEHAKPLLDICLRQQQLYDHFNSEKFVFEICKEIEDETASEKNFGVEPIRNIFIKKSF